MSASLDIGKLLDSTREAAEHAGIDLDVANKALDAIRPASADTPNPFDLLAAINEQIGKAETTGLQYQLIELRSRFEDEMFATEVSRIERAFRQGANVGWNFWVNTIAEAITLFRFGFAERVCKYTFPFSESQRPTKENIDRAVHCMYQSRWAEAYDQLNYLAGQDFLPAVIRARLFIMLGQIQLLHFLRVQQAKELFDTAEKLKSDDGKVLSALGDYWVREKDIEKGKSYYERAIKKEPGLPNAYVGMGEYFESEKKLETAEEWYKKAIDIASGDAQAYQRLLRLYGQPEFFRVHESTLRPIIERAIAVDPEVEYQVYLDLGSVYEQNDRFDEAQRWYEKAIALDRTRPAGYLSVAQCHEKEKRSDQAESAYKKAIEVAPECYDAYFGLTWLYEQQERWGDALEWYNRAPLHRKELLGIMRARAGVMQWKLENHTEAEDILKRELRADDHNDSAKNGLEIIAEHYQKHKDRNAATRIYSEILEILGDSYLGDYHNWLGNLGYTDGETSQAVSEYSLAIKATPTNAVFHRNLAAAYRERRDYTQSKSELDAAFLLDKDKKTYDKEMSLLVNAEGNDYYSHSDYRKAIELYTKAIEFDESNETFHSNLGGAWEGLREPGRRLETLDKGLEAFKRAQEIKRTDKYERAIERLQRKKEFASQYGEKAIDLVRLVTPIVVEVADDLIRYVAGQQDSLSDELSKQLTLLRSRLKDQFGVKIPGIQFRDSKSTLPRGAYVINIAEIPLVSGNVGTDQRFFPGSAEALSALPVTGEKATNPVTGGIGFLIHHDDWEKVETARHELWGVIEYVIRHLEAVIERNLAEFLGHQEVAEIVEMESSEALEEMRATPEKLSALTTVCRGLTAEGVPIKPFSEIYDMFYRLYPECTNLQDLIESIRSLPVLRSRLPGNDARYSLLPLGQRFEASIRNAVHQAGAHSVLAMEPEAWQNALMVIKGGIGESRNVVVVDDAQLRPFVRSLIELAFPDIPVLARRELRTDLQSKTLETAELEEEVAPAKPNFSRGRQVAVSENGPGESRNLEAHESGEIAITVFLNEAVIGKQAKADNQPIEEMFSMMQDGLFYELGILLPEVRLQLDSALKPHQFRFNINSREYASVEGLEGDQFFVNETVDRLKLFNIQGEERDNPANGNKCVVVREEEGLAEMCQKAGLTTWGPAGFLVLALSAEIRRNAAAFQTVNATEYILDSLGTAFPELIDTARKRFSVELVCLVLRNLLDEEISIRDLKSILESLLSINGTTDVDLHRYPIVFSPQAEKLCPVTGDRDVGGLLTTDYSDFVRTSMKRYISHKYANGGNTLAVYLLDSDMEKRISNLGAQPLTIEEKRNLKAAVIREVESLPPTAQSPVVLTTMDIRRTVRKLIETDFPNLAVLSFQELSLDMNIQPIARISWSKAPGTAASLNSLQSS